MINCLQRTLLGKSQRTQLRLEIGYVRTLLGKSQEYLILNTDVPLSNWGPIHCSAAIHFVEILSKSAISPRSNPLSCRLPAYFHRILLCCLDWGFPLRIFDERNLKKYKCKNKRSSLDYCSDFLCIFMANSQCEANQDHKWKQVKVWKSWWKQNQGDPRPHCNPDDIVLQSSYSWWVVGSFTRIWQIAFTNPGFRRHVSIPGCLEVCICVFVN